MEFKDQLLNIANRIESIKDSVQTEESTKNAFVMPFISALGYDVFNPLEVVPEYIADVGIKKGEKVDYCIRKDGDAIIIMECKHWNQHLDVHNSQLFRYFVVTNCKFAILTNGIEYRFFTDLEDENKMDERPFFTFSMEKLNDAIITELKKFRKEKFDVDRILTTASDLKYSKLIKEILLDEFDNPSDDFVKHFAYQVYDGRITSKVLSQFKELTQKTIKQYVNELVHERLQGALKTEEEKLSEGKEELVEEVDNGIVTTEEELTGYRIVQAILSKHVPLEKVHHRDAKTYFSILYDNNNRKPICRLWLNTNKWYISLFDEEKNEDRREIEKLEDIYKYEDQLISVAKNYDNS